MDSSSPGKPSPHDIKFSPRSGRSAALILIFLSAGLSGNASGQEVTEFSIPTASADPRSITAGPDGNLWFTEGGAIQIGRIATTGIVTEFPFPGTNGSGQIRGIAAGPDGNLWFDAIGRISTAGVITEFPNVRGGQSITAGPDGNLWVTDGDTIRRINADGVITGQFTVPAAEAGSQQSCSSITVGPDGNLWFGCFATVFVSPMHVNVVAAALGRITTAGVITKFSVPLANAPGGIVTGPDGNLWFTEASGRIGRITTAGVITEFSIPTAGSGPYDIAAGWDGNLWFTERSVNKIGRITTAGVVTEFPIPTANSGLWGIAAGPDGNIWFTESNSNKIGRITTTCSDATTLCLNGGRFQVRARWEVPAQGRSGEASAVALTADSGYFWFFDSANVEVMVKVLDGSSVNGHFWVFYGALSDVGYTITVTDTVTGVVKTYTNPSGTLASVADTSAFSRDASQPEGMEDMPSATSGERTETASAAELYAMHAALSQMKPALAAGPCDSSTLCLYNGRFRVTVTFSVPSQGIAGTGRIVPVTPDTGYLQFFGLDNIDLVIKVLDGQAINGHFWVFYGALTNVEYEITVTDTFNGLVKTYTNPNGQLSSVADTTAFPPAPWDY